MIQTKTLGELILSKQTPERSPRVEHYLIPYYQRGYRWEEYHVESLLRDIHDFIQSRGASTNYYCLQPIVVASSISEDDNLPIWEVIDGQQRLITLNIIFNVIKKTNFKLIFGNRKESTKFIDNLSLDTINDDSPDFHFMSLAYQTIKNWFDKHSDDVSYIDEFYTICCKGVKVIWYQLKSKTENEKIEVFNRLNIGKIPLTDAELIKALTLSEVKKGLSSREAILRQSDVSAEWYDIESKLQNDEFWCFLNKSKEDYKSGRIELIFDLLAGKKSSNYSTYLWLEEQLKKEEQYYETFWKDVKEVFTILNSWFNNRDIYHYIGFLLTVNMKHINLESLLALSKEKKKKSDFRLYLKSEIAQYIKNIDLSKLSYESNKKDIEGVLLLFNILTMASYADIPQNRFPFDLYKNVNEDGGWSLEHIHAQKSEDIKDGNAIRLWLKETQKALAAIDSIIVEEEYNEEHINDNLSSVKGEIDDILKLDKIDIMTFNTLKNKIIKMFDSKSIHELDNLALLSKKNNSSLQNAIFPAKRNKIIELESKGEFIPPCTKNVFLKLYNNSNNQPFYWSKKDKETYYDSIKSTLSQFTINYNNEIQQK